VNEKTRHRIAQAFLQNFAERGEVGASVSAYRDGKEILSLAEGWCDHEQTEPWRAKTHVLIWSATKGPAAACVLHCLHMHGIPLFTPVADIWPRFAQAGKEEVTLAELLSHRAGQAALAESVPLEDHDAVIATMEQQPILHDSHAYHPRTFGYLLDEVIRLLNRGQTLGDYFRQHFGDPLGLDLWIGLPEELHNAVAHILPAKTGSDSQHERFAKAIGNPQSLTARAFASPRGLSSVSAMNTREARKLSLPAFGGIATADALAKFYDSMLRTPFLDQMTTPLAMGYDEVLHVDTAFSAGMMLDPLDENGSKIRSVFGPSLTAFGHAGAGGSVAFADPENGFSFAYVMNQMEHGVLPGAKATALVKALYDM
jgi:CubicO group peptidase (beta-lactamase class C family)